MIVKNCENTIERILKFAHLFDQFVIVDTGSTDDTLQVLSKYIDHIEVHYFKWIDDFSAARNFALSKLHTDTFMWLDADDLIDEGQVEAWRELATCLLETTCDLYYLPYVYSSDNFGNPLLVQERERIAVGPAMWEWRNTIHENLCWKGIGRKDPYSRAAQGADIRIVHQPLREQGYKDRNWIIINRLYLSGDKSPSTLYYLQREAIARGQDEFAITLGTELVAMPEDDLAEYQLYEGFKHLGDSYSRLYLKTKNDDYLQKALDNYFEAITYQRTLNEAKASLAEFYVQMKDYNTALSIVEDMSSTYPLGYSAICQDLYGGYPYALKASILTKFGNLAEVIRWHLYSLGWEQTTSISFQTDKWIRRQIQNKNVGVIFSEEPYLMKAQKLKELMLSADIYDEIIISDDPLIATYALGVYFHIGSSDSLYVEETNPYVTKVWVTENPDTAYGYRASCFMPEVDEDYETLLSVAFPQVDVIVEPDFDKAMRRVRGSLAKYCFASHSTGFVTAGVTEETITSPKPLVWTTDKYDGVAALGGKTKELQRWVVRGDGLFATDDVKEKRWDYAPNYGVDWCGLSNLGFAHKTIAFYAEGIEPWDGLTPYRFGVGGSESSLIYAAEELVKEGYPVTVYCPTNTPKTIAGVQYVPNEYLKNLTTPYDVFVSSRIPDVLVNRYGMKQYLWLHDLYHPFYTPEGAIFDKIIAVSDYEAAKIAKEGYKVVVIPNGIHHFEHDDKNRVKGRCIWLSSPDRGLIDLVLQDKAIQDMWITYSWFGVNQTQGDDELVYQRTQREKFLLRKRGWKIVGRLPIDELKELLTTVDVWPYYSSFKETFCISLLEAVDAGVYPVISEETGAAPETFALFVPNSDYFSHVVEKDQMLAWVESLLTKDIERPHLQLDPTCFWENVVKKWIRLI